MLKIAWRENYAHPLPDGHRFPMEKYSLLPEQLLYEGTVTEDNFFSPDPLPEELILRTHDVEYWQRLSTLQLTPREQRKTGFPHSPELIHREICIMQGTLQAAMYALEYGAGMNIAGGTHHAFTNRGEGFCLLNDIAIAAQYLLDTNRVQRVLVVDLDVHQGNGTAEIFANEERVFTFSMHGGNNYPLHKERSDLDIPLADGTDTSTYLGLLNQHLPALFDQHQPEFVFYQCGVDILETDKLGKLGVSLAGCKERDRIVLELCHQHEVPVCMSMGGGYAPQLRDIVEAHANTYRMAQHIFF